MKIKSIKFENNNILGNLFLDFTDCDGNVLNTIIIAGENGCGKSTILQSIYDFSCYSLVSVSTSEKRIFVVEFSDEEMTLINNSEALKNHFPNGIKNNELKFTFDFSIQGNWQQIKIDHLDKSNNPQNPSSKVFSRAEGKPLIKSIFSDVEINFNPNAISSVTARDVDQKVSSSVKSTSSLATEITQLLVDVQALDDAEFTEWARNNTGKLIDVSKLDSRIKRFKSAFSYMFSTMNYDKVKNVNDKKQVVFEEKGKEIPIENLSSGEKQIVFRGSFLLKDQKSNHGIIVLLDEPEISLHPRWQLRILNFLKKLFSDNKGTQTSQIFIATHSPFIIHNNTRFNDKVVILKRSAANGVLVEQSLEYHGWTSKQQVNEAFNIDIESNIEKTTVFVEGETDELYLKKAMQTLKKEHLAMDIKWIGKLNNSGNAEFTGDSALNKTKSFLTANPDILKHKIVLLYDSDTNKPDENNNLLYIRRMPKNDRNIIYTVGIENLLVLPDKFDRSKFIKESEKTDRYGVSSTIRELDKKTLCDFVCNDFSETEQRGIFAGLESVFDIINQVIQSDAS